MKQPASEALLIAIALQRSSDHPQLSVGLLSKSATLLQLLASKAPVFCFAHWAFLYFVTLSDSVLLD